MSKEKQINELKADLDTMIGNGSQLKAEKLYAKGWRKQSELLINDPKSNNYEVIRNKQIEEMAKALTKYEKGLCERLPKDKCLLTSAIHAQVSCDYCKIAEFLYNAGYRKQSEGGWIDREDNLSLYFECSVCKKAVMYRTNYCPTCGAKMKGGAE